MNDVYLTNGTNIGRLLAVIAIGTTPTLILERMDTHTLLAAPLGAGISVVDVCVRCLYRPKITDATTGAVISQFCVADAGVAAAERATYEDALRRMRAGQRPADAAETELT